MNRHTLQKLREQENEEGEEEKKEEVTQLIEQQFNISGGQQIIVQKGANPVIHIHVDKDERAIEEKKEALSEAAALEKEDEELLLPVFKGSRENLRQFFAEVQGAEPEQVTNKLNAWIVDGKIAKKFNIKNLWEILYKMKIYPYTYEAMNKHVMR